MKNKFKRGIFREVVLSFIVLFLFMPGIAYAHGMHLTLEEPGTFRVEYEGGGFSPTIEVTLYDENGQVIAKGPVDAEGKFRFDPSLGVHRAVADDGMGHRAEYRKEMESTPLPKLPVVLGIFALIAVIALVFNHRSKSKTTVSRQ